MKLRIFLVIASLVLSILIGISLARHNRGDVTHPSQSDDRLVIGLSMDTLKEERWQRDRDYFLAAAEKLGAQVIVHSAEGDDTKQLQQIKSMLISGIDVLVIIPHDGAAMAQAVREAHAAKVPVIAYDRMITDCDLDLYLSFDNIKVGEAQARYLIDHLPPGQKKIVRIYGSKTDHNAFLFKQGQDNILEPYMQSGEVEVVHEDWAMDWSPENAKKITHAALMRTDGDFSGILSSNDGTAGGAIQTLKEAQLAGKILVTGQDADLVACQRIARGTQSMTVLKPLSHLASKAAELAVALAEKQVIVANGAVDNQYKKVPSVLLEVISVDKENLQKTIIEEGFHSAEDVYGQEK